MNAVRKRWLVGICVVLIIAYFVSRNNPVTVNHKSFSTEMIVDSPIILNRPFDVISIFKNKSSDTIVLLNDDNQNLFSFHSRVLKTSNSYRHEPTSKLRSSEAPTKVSIGPGSRHKVKHRFIVLRDSGTTSLINLTSNKELFKLAPVNDEISDDTIHFRIIGRPNFLKKNWSIESAPFLLYTAEIDQVCFPK